MKKFLPDILPKLQRITRSCVIQDHSIYRDGQLFYQGIDSPVSDFLVSAYQYIKPEYPKYYKMDNLSRLGWIATEILLAGVFPSDNQDNTMTGVVLCNSNSSLDTDIRYFETTKSVASPALFVYTLPNIVIGEICIRHKIKGENTFFVFSEFDTNFFSTYIQSLFAEGLISTCICGWVDVIREKYKAVLFLVEKDDNEKNGFPVFDKENIDTIYNLPWRN